MMMISPLQRVMILNSNPIIVISGILFFIVVSFFAVLGVISAVDDIDESVFSIKTAVGDNVDVFIKIKQLKLLIIILLE